MVDEAKSHITWASIPLEIYVESNVAPINAEATATPIGGGGDGCGCVHGHREEALALQAAHLVAPDGEE